MSQPRRNIKVPPARRWREFRMRYLPVLVFCFAGFAAVILWQKTVVGPTMVGEVEGIATPVRALNAGTIIKLKVIANQFVKKDQEIAEILSSDFRPTTAEMQDVRNRITLSQLEINAILDRDRLSYHYENMSMDTLRFRAELMAVEAELPVVDAAFERAERGFKEQVVPFNDYESARRTRDSMRARVVELRKLVQQAEEHLADAQKNVQGFTKTHTTLPLSDALEHLRMTQRELEQTRVAPMILKAPMDGIVGTIMHREGEAIQPGDTILTVHASEGSRIVTYFRQGMINNPKKGTPVTVRCRSHSREEAMGRVQEIGHGYESITNKALLRPGVMFEMGLPVGVNIPERLRSVLRPGELVDLGIGE